MNSSLAPRFIPLVVGLALGATGAAASAANPVPKHADSLTARPPPPSQVGAAKSNVFFVNYDGVTIEYTGQWDDAAQNISQFQDFAGDYAAYGNGAKRAASLQAVRADWAKYDVVITDKRPADGSYTMAVVSPTTPFGPDVHGIAPLDCDDMQASNIVFAYFSADDQHAATVQATTISQQIANAYGLEHVKDKSDIMYGYLTDGDPSFLDQCLPSDDMILCGPQHTKFCQSGQNSHQELLWLFGSFVPDVTPPSISITSPADGAVFDAGADVTVTASAADDVGVVEVELFVNGKSVQTDDTEPYSWGVQDIALGDYCFKATARDLAGNLTDSDKHCVTVVDVGDPTDSTTTEDSTGDPPTSEPGPVTPTEGGSGGNSGGPSTTSEPGGSSEDSTGDPQSSDESGCGCSNTPPSALFAVFAVLLLPRRRVRPRPRA